MPELAEVEYYRRQWDAGLGERIVRVHLHETKRVFRGTDNGMVRQLRGERLRSSEAAGKQMLFRFSGDFWQGIHLGMS
jgi:formamidopyrimidine-DNA glycosylase